MPAGKCSQQFSRLRLLPPLAVLLVVLPGIASGDNDASTALDAIVDELAAERSSRQASDLSRQSFDNELGGIQGLLARLRRIDRDALTPDEDIDWRFAESILRGKEIQLGGIEAWKRDPRVYMQFRPIGRAIGRPGDLAGKAEELIGVLRLLPAQLENGRKNLEEYIPRFQELSVFMAEGGLTMLNGEVVEFAGRVPDQRAVILELNDQAIAALEGFHDFLENELPEKPEGSWAIGKELYNQALSDQYLLPYDADELYEFAVEKFDETVRELEDVARRIDPDKTWQALAVEVKNDYPSPHSMIEVHQQWVDRSREHILDNGLVPIPWPETVTVVPRAEYLRKYSYYGNFSSAKEANEEGVFASEWMINPFEDQWDERTKQEYLVEHDYGVIIVTAPHEAYAGHHVQSLYQLHNPRKLRRAYGIPIFSEGWGLYNEQLMRETGFFPDERIVLRALQLRLWRNARVVWDVGIHTGKMSYEEAIDLLSERVGFLRWAAQLEIDGSAQNPIYRIGYFLGMSEILDMREEYRQRAGDDFTLSLFHKNLLEVGNMPIALMRDGLMLTLEERASRAAVQPYSGKPGR